MANTGITGAIDRFEGDIAVISLDDGQKLHYAKSSLPADAHEGSVITLTITTSAQEEAHRQQLAQAVLQELINPADKEA
jgi:hypothetical protein